MLSCVLILSESQVATGNAVAEAMGWGPNSYSIPLSADGAEPVTHKGLHTWATEEFQQMIASGYYPPQVAAAGINQPTFEAMMAALISSFWPDYVDHFATVCAENGLQLVMEAE